MLSGKFSVRCVDRSQSVHAWYVCSKATNGTTESAIMNELRDMKNDFRG